MNKCQRRILGDVLTVDDLKQATTSFSYGRGNMVRQGQIISIRHPAYKGREHLFTEVKETLSAEDLPDTEVRNNRPGEQATVSKGTVVNRGRGSKKDKD